VVLTVKYLTVFLHGASVVTH